MDQTPALALPYVAAAQAQKHVTVNEAMTRLDALVQLHVRSRSLTSPPPDAAEGERFIVPAATESWSSETGSPVATGAILRKTLGGWTVITPIEGWLAIVRDEASLVVFGDNAWDTLDAANVERLGVGTTANDPNRLAVASASSLFTHATDGDHRLTVNKEAESRTASIVLQTAYSGRAEIGTTGSDELAFKVSSEGSSWTEALTIDPASGIVDMPERPVARGHLSGGWRTVPDGGESGVDAFTISRGITLGDPLAGGFGHKLKVGASGLYRVDLRVYADADSEFRLALRKSSEATAQVVLHCNQAETLPFTQSVSTILDLANDEQLWLSNTRPARCYHAPGHTEIMVERL